MQQVVGVVLKPKVKGAIVALQQAQAALPHVAFIGEGAGHNALPKGLDGVRAVDAKTFAELAHLVVAFGGDGTLIHAAGLLVDRIVPILGVNFGHIGFLTEVTTRDEMVQLLPRALNHALPYTDRMRLDVSVRRRGETLLQRRVLNDAVVSMRSLARIATYRVLQGEELLTTIRGDGVIVSTPTGSTAYALAAGGPILWPQLEAVCVTPICPHQLTQRALVLPPQQDITVTLASQSTVFVSLDGHVGQSICAGDSIICRQAPVPSRLLSVPWRNYFQTLRTKLRWGEG